MPEELDDIEDPSGEFYYIELEFLFDSDIEGTHISEIIADIVKEFDTGIMDTDIVLDSNDPTSEFNEGGIALYDIFPNRPNLLETFKERLTDFDVEITSWPTKG